MAADRLPQQTAAEEDTPFITTNLLGLECHGRILEIDHQELFFSKWHKLFNSLIRGEPYQFAHQTVEYVIRVENITSGVATEITDFSLYGSYLGRMQPGDEVLVHAKDKGDRRVVTSIQNITTGSEIRPGLQISAGIIRLFALSIISALILMCLEIHDFFVSGTAAKLFSDLLNMLIPALITIFFLCFLWRSIFPRRHRWDRDGWL